MKVDLGELKKRFQARAALAITLESGRIAVAVVRQGADVDARGPEFAIPIGAEAVVANPEKAGSEIAERLAAERIRERRCVVSVPPGWAMTSTTEVPEMTEENLRGYLELRAEREFPTAITELRLAHSIYRTPDGKQRATVVAIPAKKLAAIEQMLEEAGCKAISISLGLDRCLTHGNGTGVVHLLANCDHVDLVVTASGGIVALRSLAGPVPAVDVPFDGAGFCREVRITLGRLPAPVREQIREAHFGGAARASETLCLETRHHLQRLGLSSPECRRTEGAEDLGPGAAVDAAERILSKQSVTFEFAPREAPKWQTLLHRFDTGRRRWMILAGVALVALPLIVFIVRSQIAGNLEDEWNGMRTSVGQLEELQQKIRRFRPWFDDSPTSLRIMEGLVSSFPEQGDVWAKSVQVTGGAKVTCTGFARNQTALLAFMDRLRAQSEVTDLQVQSVRGENPVEFSFTYKIAGAE